MGLVYLGSKNANAVYLFVGGSRKRRPFGRFFWSRLPDLNWGPSLYKRVALPTELRRLTRELYGRCRLIAIPITVLVFAHFFEEFRLRFATLEIALVRNRVRKTVRLF